MAGKPHRALGHARNGRPSPEYTAWLNMVRRCTSERATAYAHYGGRGIKVCDRWLAGFANFLADVGLRPSSKHTLDRANVNGDYEPGNVRWVTWTTQANNRRTARVVTIDGVTKTVTEWSRETGVRPPLFYGRIANGWSERDAMTTPPLPTGIQRRRLQGRAA